ncbi:VOC family protein [Sulfurospirillum arsenophilum]|uniref:VOC family protein n=1 Tax=Sulfurospirillum arsenophilum TaxID=56698 RepID=UPI0005A8D249|nr:VOC family protein [Sulfurospirillum arsenophilum]
MSLITHLDHLVLTVANIERSCAFYTSVLKMEEVTFKGRKALKFGHSKINLHEVGYEFEPKALYPMAGSADLCFITPVPIEQCIEHFKKYRVLILEGPIKRTGARSDLLSVYFRDPDGNLIEVANELVAS